MTELSGLRVLVAEDEGMVALLIEDILQDLGCVVAASVARFTDAQSIAGTAEIDLAVLDVNLHGQHIFPVAEVLRERAIPLVFSTGYGAGGIPPAFAGHPVVGKPFSQEQLREKILLALRR